VYLNPFLTFLLSWGSVLSLAVSNEAKAAGWVHPAGFVDVGTLAEIRHKRDTQDWAKNVLASLDQSVQPWLAQPLERLEALLPKRKTQVYWLLLCPECRQNLPFDPFNDQDATCRSCGRTYPLTQPSTATPPDSPYAGTLYDGWGCYYLQNIAETAEHLALLHALGADRRYAERAADILRLFVRYIRPLPVLGSGTQHVIWTYNMEGDCSILTSLVTAYELLRGVAGLFPTEEQEAIQHDLLQHWADSVFRVEEDNSVSHNNTYAYLTAVALVGCALEDTDYVDWAFGCRQYAPEKRPNHHSLAWLADHNYLEDGATRERCSAYHLYALGPHCRALVFGARLAQQMPDLFPPEMYDETDPRHRRAWVARRAIKWFTAQAFPDLTMAPFGDMGGRVSLATYPLTAEIGYRYLGIEEVGHYPSIRQGNRGLTGLIFGADTIEEKPIPYRSAFLSSGYVALKRQTQDNQLYAGLNAVAPGSMHCHGDRLNLLTYSRDRLLTGEKRTQYSDPDQRVYSGASYAHNTVTVDETSQEHGDRLQGERIPHLETFVDLPALSAAEAHGDQIYPQTRLYRRWLCQFDEYLLDLFRVEGGTLHDWFYHGIGEEPMVTVPLEERPHFEPALYVMRGEPAYRHGVTDDSFSATWRLPAEAEADYPGRRRDVFSRVTLAGFPRQEIHVLRTFPDPGKYSLMVRHVGTADPFVAVHEAYFDAPIAVSVRTLTGDAPAAVEIRHADGGRRLALWGPGAAAGGLVLQGQGGVVQLDSAGRLRSLALLRGTSLRYGELRVETDEETCLSVTVEEGRLVLVSSPPVAYRTIEGEPIYTVGQEAVVRLRLPVALSPTGRDFEAQVPVPGQTPAGPQPIEVAL